MAKHEHIMGRPRNYISTKHFYRGKHRGLYKPGFHWSHVKCYPDGICHLSTEYINLQPYLDPNQPKPETITYRFV